MDTSRTEKKRKEADRPDRLRSPVIDNEEGRNQPDIVPGGDGGKCGKKTYEGICRAASARVEHLTQGIGLRVASPGGARHDRVRSEHKLRGRSRQISSCDGDTRSDVHVPDPKVLVYVGG